MRLMFWIALVVFLIDQASKYYVVHTLQLAQFRSIDVFPPFFNLRMAWNEGVNFGIFDGLGPWFLISVALTISVWVVLWVRSAEQRTIVYISAGLLVGGALGNVIDRVVYGAVADFINMSCCGFDNPYAFNVADIVIFAGAIGLVLFTSQKKTS